MTPFKNSREGRVKWRGRILGSGFLSAKKNTEDAEKKN